MGASALAPPACPRTVRMIRSFNSFSLSNSSIHSFNVKLPEISSGADASRFRVTDRSVGRPRITLISAPVRCPDELPRSRQSNRKLARAPVLNLISKSLCHTHTRPTNQIVPASAITTEANLVTNLLVASLRCRIDASIGSTSARMHAWPISTPALNDANDQPIACLGSPTSPARPYVRFDLNDYSIPREAVGRPLRVHQDGVE